MDSAGTGFECGLNGVCDGVGEKGKKCLFLAVGLQLGLQSGVTFFKKWGYIFRDLWYSARGGELTILK